MAVTVEGLAKVNALTQSNLETLQKNEAFSNRQAAAKQAADLFRQGKIEDAYMVIAGADPEYAVQLAPQLQNFMPDLAGKLSGAKQTGELSAQTGFNSNPRQLLDSTLANQLKIAQMNAEASQQATQDRVREKAASKAETRAIVSDKQLSEIDEFDKTIQQLEGLVTNKKDEFIGPVQGNIPKLFTGAQEEAYRAQVGRVADAYRKLITGAAAGDKELARVESRLPKIDDKPEQFAAKAENFLNELRASRSRYLENLSRKGKDVNEFLQGPAGTPPASFTPGTILKSKKDNKYYEVQADGSRKEVPAPKGK